MHDNKRLVFSSPTCTSTTYADACATGPQVRSFAGLLARCCAAALATLFVHGPLAAGPVQVTSTDAVSTSSCTLADAIDTVLQGRSFGACAWSPDPYVKIDKGSTYLLEAPVTVSGALEVRGDATATDPAVIAWPAGQSGRFFDAAPGASLELVNLELTGGSAIEGGGVRIQAAAEARLFGATLSSHTADNAGGAIDNAGTLSIEKSTFEANSATFGGAIYNRSGGLVHVLGSLFAGNSAALGGALYHDGEALDIETSTLSANQGIYGGALYGKSGDVTIDFSTFVDNAGSTGSAIFMEWGTVQLARSALTGPGDLCFGSQYISSVGGNVLSDDSCIPPSALDEVTGEPIGMSPLVHHGGLTRVHVPLCDWSNGRCNSPLLDRGDLGLCVAGVTERDQRDQFNRLHPDPSSTVISGGAACDVGAYEAVCQGSAVNGPLVAITLREYQVLDGEPVLLDNGDCFGHPLWDEESQSGCELRWTVHGPRLEVEDIVFLDPACQETCFPDATACEQQCTGVGGPAADVFLPSGWSEQDDGTSYAVLVPDCDLPQLAPGEAMRYLIGLRDKSQGVSIGYWDPKTPVLNEDPPEGSCSGCG